MTDHEFSLNGAVCKIATDVVGDGQALVSLWASEAKALLVELDRMGKDNANLRRRLAHVTAQHAYVQGANFATIDQQIREFGFRLDGLDGSAPRIVSLGEAKAT